MSATDRDNDHNQLQILAEMKSPVDDDKSTDQSAEKRGPEKSDDRIGAKSEENDVFSRTIFDLHR